MKGCKFVMIISSTFNFCINRPTASVTCVWVGVDSAWGQEKLEARKCSKMPQNPTRQVHALLCGTPLCRTECECRTMLKIYRVHCSMERDAMFLSTPMMTRLVSPLA